MTAVTERPSSATDVAARRLGFLPWAEIALALVTLATVAGMWRLFVDGSYFAPLAAHVVAAHVLAATLRRRGVPPASSALLCLVAALLALTWGHLLGSTTYGIPTGTTAASAREQLELAWRTFGEVRAPAPVLDGFLLSAGAALWIGVWLADLAAFRLWTPFEALIPSGTLFVFASLFSADRSRATAGALWFAAALLFVLLHRSARQQSSPSWLGSDARHGTAALVRAGAGLAAFAVAAGWFLGPKLPGAEAEPVFPFAQQEDGGQRTTVSPLVEIERRLVEQSQTQLFTVEVDDPAERAYWRLTALDTFDGDIWRSGGRYGDADGDLAGGIDDDQAHLVVEQHFEITGLATIWLPAAFEAAEIDAGDADVRWEEASATLIVSTEHEDADGLAYDVTSTVPTFDPAVLEAATGAPPADVAEDNTALPSTFPASVSQEAQRIITEAGATSAYAQALALQNSFRDGRFEYSLDGAPSGHSASAIEDFLFVSRTGYCEQFAGTYAAMARAIGLPARVAVGFTTGDPDPARPGRFSVRGEHAHAWPEVWIGGVGWVPFEPTPGRGSPQGEAHTGVPESQDEAGASTTPTTRPAEAVPGQPTTTVPAGGTPTTPTSVGAGGAAAPTTTTTEPRASVVTKAVLQWSLVALGVAAAVVGLFFAVAGSIVAFRRWRRARRLRDASSVEDLVVAQGEVALELVAVLGIVRHRWETANEFSRRLARELQVERAVLLGSLQTRAEFDPAGLSPEDAERAAEVLEEIAAAVRARATPMRRFLGDADPRSAERRARARGVRPVGPRIQIRPLATEG